MGQLYLPFVAGLSETGNKVTGGLDEEVPEEILATLQLRILCHHESKWYEV